jgi:hypothetical protein
MSNSKVSSNLARLWWFWLAEDVALSEMVSVKLLLEGLVGSLGEHTLLLKDG